MVVLGRIAAPYGVRGWVRLHAFGDDPARWQEIARWWLGANAQDFSDWRACTVHAMRPQGKDWLVKLTGVDDRNGAEALVGQYVGAPRASLPETEENEYYWADLVGLNVANEQQQALGRVSEMLESGAHAVMVVTQGEGPAAVERLIPFVAAVVKDVDVAAGRIAVDWQADW